MCMVYTYICMYIYMFTICQHIIHGRKCSNNKKKEDQSDTYIYFYMISCAHSHCQDPNAKSRNIETYMYMHTNMCIYVCI